jgi:hypothetical protein
MLLTPRFQKRVFCWWFVKISCTAIRGEDKVRWAQHRTAKSTTEVNLCFSIQNVYVPLKEGVHWSLDVNCCMEKNLVRILYTHSLNTNKFCQQGAIVSHNSCFFWVILHSVFLKRKCGRDNYRKPLGVINHNLILV